MNDFKIKFSIFIPLALFLGKYTHTHTHKW